MIPDGNLVRYACVAYRPTTSDAGGEGDGASTILAEFVSSAADASTQAVAQECLLRTPANHSIFNHNIHGCSYTFWIEDPFVFFAISDEKLPKPDKIWVLTRMKDALNDISNGKKKKNRRHQQQLRHHSYCFQGEFSPVFHQLFVGADNKDLNHGGAAGTIDGLKVNGEHRSIDSGSVQSRGIGGGGGGGGRRTSGISIFSRVEEAIKKKKKMNLLVRDSPGESKDMLVENSPELSDEVTSRELALCDHKEDMAMDISARGGGLSLDDHTSEGKQKATRIWRKYVWVVLVLDLAVCLILFGIWLMICHGFQCLQG